MPETYRTLKSFTLGDETISIQFKGSTQTHIARVLDCRRDAAGVVQYLCLDRLLHRQGDEAFRLTTTGEVFRVSGCVATEITRAD